MAFGQRRFDDLGCWSSGLSRPVNVCRKPNHGGKTAGRWRPSSCPVVSASTTSGGRVGPVGGRRLRPGRSIVLVRGGEERLARGQRFAAAGGRASVGVVHRFVSIREGSRELPLARKRPFGVRVVRSHSYRCDTQSRRYRGSAPFAALASSRCPSRRSRVAGRRRLCAAKARMARPRSRRSDSSRGCSS